MALPDFYPSLSEEGWVSEPIKIADWIMADFFSSDYSQSHSHHRHVASFAYILQKNHHSINQIIHEMTKILTRYFSRYFDNVLVEIADETGVSDSATRTLGIFVSFTDKKGRRYSVGRDATFEGSKLIKVIQVLIGDSL